MRQPLKRLFRTLLPFLLLFCAFLFLLWVYFYFTQGEGKAERQYIFQRNYVYCTWKVGEELFADLFATTHPRVYTTDAYAIFNLGTKNDSMYYLLIDSTGMRKEFKIPFVVDEPLYNFSPCALEWMIQNHYTRFDIQTKQRTDSPWGDSLIAAHALTDSGVLYFAQIDKNDKTELAFIRKTCAGIDTVCRLPKEDYTSHVERFLAYNGQFLHYGNYITYTARHLPYIWIFDAKGALLTTITTRDSAPPPVVTHSGNSFVLERGSSFNTNVASFVLGKHLVVFSKRLSIKEDFLVADLYNLTDGKYVESYRIASDTFSNQDLWSLLVFKRQLLLEFETGLYPLEFFE